jgi:hypothetical protein
VGKLIEFYYPVPKAVLTLAAQGEHESGEEAPPLTPAKDILTACLESVDTIDTLLVLTCDKEGTLAFVGNCDGLAESLLFMDLVKAQALFSRVEGGGGVA